MSAGARKARPASASPFSMLDFLVKSLCNGIGICLIAVSCPGICAPGPGLLAKQTVGAEPSAGRADASRRSDSGNAAVPALSGHVLDQTRTLSVDETAQLEAVLRDFETRTGAQLVVLVLQSTRPESIEQYALRVAQAWRLGRKKIDDGAILLIGKADRELRIEVGYGLEGALNDATSRRIIADVITPHLQRGEFFAGIRDGTDAMIGVLERSSGQSGELPKPLAQPQSRSPLGEIQAFFPLIIMISLLLGGFFRLLLGRMPGALLTAVLAGVMAWFFAGLWVVCLIAGLVAFVFTLTGGGALGLLSRHRSGRWGNPGDQSGFGIGGNAGGGGFGGGGGGFGGGGASGRW